MISRELYFFTLYRLLLHSSYFICIAEEDYSPVETYELNLNNKTNDCYLKTGCFLLHHALLPAYNPYSPYWFDLLIYSEGREF